MVVYPPQPTSEEKALRKRYARLQELTKEVRLSVKKSLPPSASKSSLDSSTTQTQPTKKETVNPKDAKEAARRLLQAGKLTIQNKANAKSSGFKRVGDGASRGIAQPPPAKKPHIASSTSKAPLGKPKPKILAADQNALYSRFVKASDQITTRKIPKKADNTDEDTVEEQPQERLAFSTKDCTVFVKWSDSVLGEDELRTAFVRFGQIRDFRLHHRNKAFITFENPSISRHVRNEMNRGMIRGVEMRVDMASEDNGFVELPEEAADQPWAKIAAGLPPTDSPSKAISSSRSIRSYATDF